MVGSFQGRSVTVFITLCTVSTPPKARIFPSLRRGRSTWLLSHVVAGTPLHIVQHVAGSLSGNTLTELLQYTKHTLDDDTAAVGALRA